MSSKRSKQLSLNNKPSCDAVSRPTMSDVVEGCISLDLPTGTITETAQLAVNIYKVLVAIDWCGGRSQEAITAACIYTASRMQGNEVSGLEAKVTTIVGMKNVQDLRDLYNAVLEKREKMETVTRSAPNEADRDPVMREYLQYCEPLKLPLETACVAMRLGGQMAVRGWCEGHRGKALKAAYIFAASWLTGKGLGYGVDLKGSPHPQLHTLLATTMVQDGRAVDAKDLREFWNAYAWVWAKRYDLLTTKFAFSVGLVERLPEPPSESLEASS